MEQHRAGGQKIPALFSIYAAALCLILLIAAAIFLYYPSLSYPFEFDDYSNIVKYFKIRHATLRSLFFANSRWISYWLNGIYYWLSPDGHKFDPFWYRVGCITLHTICGAAIFCTTTLIMRLRSYPVLSQMGLLVPLLTAGLFLLHPVQTQTVSYVIQGQLEGLAGGLCMIMTCCLLAYGALSAESSSRLSRGIVLATLFLCATVACGSKEIILVVPFLLLLVDWFCIAQGSLEQLRRRWWIHLLVALLLWGGCIYLLRPQYFVTILGGSMELANNVGNVLTHAHEEKITAGKFLISQFKVILHYLGIFFWPFAMSADYDWKLSLHLFAPDSIFPLLALILLACYLLFRLSRDRTDFVSFCLLWFFIAILPRSSIVPSTELLADYKTYIASFGISLFQAAWVARFFWWLKGRVWWRGGLVTLYMMSWLFLIGVAAIAYHRNLVWSSPAAFWADVIRHAPNRARAYNNYGVALCEKGDHEKAIRNFLHAVALDSRYADPYNNLSVAYCALRRFDEAIAALRRGIAIMPLQPEAYNNLASVMMSAGKEGEVEQILLHAIRLRPHYGKAYFNLGKFYFKNHRDEAAWEAFKAACTRADFDNEMGFAMYANLCMVTKRYAEAVDGYSAALACNPASFELAVRRLYAAEQAQRHADVDRWMQALVQENPTHYGLWVQYGDILKQRGDLNGAIDWYQRALAQVQAPGIWYKLAHAACAARKPQLARQALRRAEQGPIPEHIKGDMQRLKGDVDRLCGRQGGSL